MDHYTLSVYSPVRRYRIPLQNAMLAKQISSRPSRLKLSITGTPNDVGAVGLGDLRIKVWINEPNLDKENQR